MKSPPDNRQLARLAAIIHSRLLAARQTSFTGDLPELAWSLVQRARHQLRQAQYREWRHAERAMQFELQHQLERLGQEVQQLLTRFNQSPATIASTYEILQDLRALHDEFAEVRWRKKDNALSVTTELITLEGRYLGPFTIELDLRHWAPHPSYRIVANDPHPSGRDSEITHPHVQGGQLCEGEGTMPIRAAVREGRLLDFFLIVGNVLRTYNAGSPYVSLDTWDGVSCSECDYAMNEDEARHCERCETPVCSECVRCCCDCSDQSCSSCVQMCHSCEQDLCRGCAKDCRDCERSFCSSCLQDDERCPSCHEQFQHQADEEANPAIHAV